MRFKPMQYYPNRHSTSMPLSTSSPTPPSIPSLVFLLLAPLFSFRFLPSPSFSFVFVSPFCLFLSPSFFISPAPLFRGWPILGSEESVGGVPGPARDAVRRPVLDQEDAFPLQQAGKEAFVPVFKLHYFIPLLLHTTRQVIYTPRTSSQRCFLRNGDSVQTN